VRVWNLDNGAQQLLPNKKSVHLQQQLGSGTLHPSVDGISGLQSTEVEGVFVAWGHNFIVKFSILDHRFNPVVSRKMRHLLGFMRIQGGFLALEHTDSEAKSTMEGVEDVVKRKMYGRN